MANRAWLDDVRASLAEHALPTAYIQRFVSELSDHIEDLKEENMNTDASVLSRLGEANQVADAAVTAYRRQSFLGRHSAAAFLVFAVSPVLSMVVCSILMAVGLRVVFAIAERFGGFSDEGISTQPGPIALAAAGYLFSVLFVVIPAVLASLLYCKLAKRLGIGRKWMFVSSAVLAVTAMLPGWAVTTRLITGTGHYAVCVGLWVPGLCGWTPPNSLLQLLQLAVPLAIGWWFMRRQRVQGQAQLTS
jgi:hypothetical protein